MKGKNLIEKIQYFIISCFEYIGNMIACLIVGLSFIVLSFTPYNQKLIEFVRNAKTGKGGLL